MFLTPSLLAVIVGVAALFVVSRKWCLPMRKVASIIAVSTIIAVGVDLLVAGSVDVRVRPVLVWLIQAATFVSFVLWLFYRDPERRIPAESGLVVSPADGVVIYVRKLEPGEPMRSDKNGASMRLDEMKDTDLARQALWQIGISMVFTDVHVNRSPIAGTVALVHHRPGRFLSLRRQDALGVNERQTLVITNGTFEIGLVQIASRLVRQIVSYVAPGEALDRGQRVGMIRFGSQVDLFIPLSVAPILDVDVGHRTVAGETVVCRTRV